CLQTKSSPYSF
nr:immunoglobulin light chain junction region [Macaca mulatta]MOX84610.1 immunoglobulin light chain junction region [Macaca mulatta]MOX84622.1 immunoglobulin light chain junction region [Macaca mulatta]MOX84773.1 immunoglobulin light chain junction region [Macaca mulatta]MOX84868.1 immunoglobulin light chain junction region [Macaca mulatta]